MEHGASWCRAPPGSPLWPIMVVMAFSPSTAAPADVQTAQGSGHLDHHQKLRAALMELRGAGLLVADDLTGYARRALTQKVITGNYTVVAADLIDTVLHVTASTNVTITLPTGLTTEVAVPWRQFGAGVLSFVAGNGATLVARGGATKSAGQYAGGVVTLVDSGTWLLEGDITT